MAFAGGAYYRQSRLSDAPDVASMPGEVDRTMAAAALAAELPIAESVYTWHYEYDALSRVTLACSNGWNDVAETCAGDAFIYEYDGGGNLLRFDKWNADANQVETVRYVINGANQIACIDLDASGTCNGSETVWEYDAFGNLLNDGSNTYIYDPANRVASITTAAGTTTYTYSGDGDRIAQMVGEVETTYLLDTATPLTMVLAETTGAEAVRYWHALDTLAQSDGTTTEYFGYDGLGSVRQLVDASGSVTLAQTFDAYGSGYATSGSASSSLGWTGEQTDSNGFVYLRARYYAPGMGRFTQMDPSKQESNPYLYGMSNPILNSDPTGHFSTCEAMNCILVCVGGNAWTADACLKCLSDQREQQQAQKRVRQQQLVEKIKNATVVITWGYFSHETDGSKRCEPPTYTAGCFGQNSSMGTLVDGGIVTHDHYGSNPTEVEERRNPPESQSSLNYLKWFDWVRFAGVLRPKYVLTSELTGFYPTKGTMYLDVNPNEIGIPTNRYMFPLLPGDTLYYTFVPGHQIQIDPYPNNLVPHSKVAVGEGMYYPAVLPIPLLLPQLSWPMASCEDNDAQHCPSLGDSGAGVFNSRGELVGVERGGRVEQGGFFYAPY